MSILERFSLEIEREGGDEWVFARIANGDTEGSIARDVGGTRRLLRQWSKLSPERAAAYREALKESKDAHAELAGEMLKGLLVGQDGAAHDYAPTREQIAAAKEVAAWHKWMAESREREQFSKAEAGVTVNVGIADLHLDALRAHGAHTLPTNVPVIEAQLCAPDEAE